MITDAGEEAGALQYDSWCWRREEGKALEDDCLDAGAGGSGGLVRGTTGESVAV